MYLQSNIIKINYKTLAAINMIKLLISVSKEERKEWSDPK